MLVTNHKSSGHRSQFIWSLPSTFAGVPDAVLPQDGGSALQLAARADAGRRPLRPAAERPRGRRQRHSRRAQVGAPTAAGEKLKLNFW